MLVLQPVGSLVLLQACFLLIDAYKGLAGISRETVLLDAPSGENDAFADPDDRVEEMKSAEPE